MEEDQMTLATDAANPESEVKSLITSDVLVEENSIQCTGKEHTEVIESCLPVEPMENLTSEVDSDSQEATANPIDSLLSKVSDKVSTLEHLPESNAQNFVAQAKEDENCSQSVNGMTRSETLDDHRNSAKDENTTESENSTQNDSNFHEALDDLNGNIETKNEENSEVTDADPTSDIINNNKSLSMEAVDGSIAYNKSSSESNTTDRKGEGFDSDLVSSAPSDGDCSDHILSRNKELEAHNISGQQDENPSTDSTLRIISPSLCQQENFKDFDAEIPVDINNVTPEVNVSLGTKNAEQHDKAIITGGVSLGTKNEEQNDKAFVTGEVSLGTRTEVQDDKAVITGEVSLGTENEEQNDKALVTGEVSFRTRTEKQNDTAFVTGEEIGNKIETLVPDKGEMKKETNVHDINEEECMMSGSNIFDKIRSETEIVHEDEAMEIASSLFLEAEESENDTDEDIGNDESTESAESLADERVTEVQIGDDDDEAMDIDVFGVASTGTNGMEQDKIMKEEESASEDEDTTKPDSATDTSANLTAAQRLIQKFKLQIQNKRNSEDTVDSDRPKRVVQLPAERKRGLTKPEETLEVAAETKKPKVMQGLKRKTEGSEADDDDTNIKVLKFIPGKPKAMEGSKPKLQKLVARKSIQKSYSARKTALSLKSTNEDQTVPTASSKARKHANFTQNLTKSVGTVEQMVMERTEKGFQSKRGPKDTVTMKVSVKIMCQEGPKRVKSTAKGNVNLIDKSVQIITVKKRADILSEKEKSTTAPAKPTVDTTAKASIDQSLTIREKNIQRLKELIKRQEKTIEMIKSGKEKNNDYKKIVESAFKTVDLKDSEKAVGKNVKSMEKSKEGEQKQNTSQSNQQASSTDLSSIRSYPQHRLLLPKKSVDSTQLKIQGGSVEYVHPSSKNMTNILVPNRQIPQAISIKPAVSYKPIMPSFTTSQPGKCDVLTSTTNKGYISAVSNVSASDLKHAGQRVVATTALRPGMFPNPLIPTMKQYVSIPTTALHYKPTQSVACVPPTHIPLKMTASFHSPSPLSNEPNSDVLPIGHATTTASFVVSPLILGSSAVSQSKPVAPPYQKPGELSMTEKAFLTPETTTASVLPKITSVRSLAGQQKTKPTVVSQANSCDTSSSSEEHVSLSLDQRVGLLKTLEKAKSLMCDNVKKSGSEDTPTALTSSFSTVTSQIRTVETTKANTSQLVSSPSTCTTISNVVVTTRSSVCSPSRAGLLSTDSLKEQATNPATDKLVNSVNTKTLEHRGMPSTAKVSESIPQAKEPPTYQKVILIQDHGKFALMPVGTNSDLPGSFFIKLENRPKYQKNTAAGTLWNGEPHLLNNEPPPLAPIRPAISQPRFHPVGQNVSSKSEKPLPALKQAIDPEVQKMIDELKSGRGQNIGIPSIALGKSVLGKSTNNTEVFSSDQHIQNTRMGNPALISPASHQNLLTSYSNKKQVSILPKPKEPGPRSETKESPHTDPYDTSPFWLTRSSKVKLQEESRIKLFLSNSDEELNGRTNVVQQITEKYPLVSSQSTFKIRFGALENQFLLLNPIRKAWAVLPDPDDEEFIQLLGIESAVQRISCLRNEGYYIPSPDIFANTPEEGPGDSAQGSKTESTSKKENIILKETSKNQKLIQIDQQVKSKMKRLIEERLTSMKKKKLAESTHDRESNGTSPPAVQENNTRSGDESEESSDEHDQRPNQVELKEIRVVVEDVMLGVKKS
ncbi:uncharacterized protein LOC135692408 [Rhopilema esculentum]|uniref:uncharacterized protein LOC135692408 n=1 Tax=Rhopilema esculentum TaxID=499914 RepID=UPI0031D82CC6